VITDAELALVQPRKTRTIDIEAFVDLEEVDPIYFDHPWFLLPYGESEGTLRAYQLLVKVMEGADQVALGRFVLRTKESLVAIRVRDGLLALSTMRFADEVRDPKGIDTGGSKPPAEQLKQAVKLVEALGEDWDPERYDDEYRKRLQNVVKRKKGGKKVEVPEREETPQPASDLMAALEQSLAQVRG
jgi:DNA end-binding protein Ku